MNECFIIGKIITKIEFKFIIKNKYKKSVVNFEIKTNEGTTIKIKSYNKIADYCYKKFEKENKVIINGKITTTGEIEAIKLEKIQPKIHK